MPQAAEQAEAVTAPRETTASGGQSTSLGIDGTTLGLYVATVFLWGVSWIAIRAQLGVVAPEMSVLWRFCWRRSSCGAGSVSQASACASPLADHLRFVGVGCCLFSLNFLCFYYGGLTVPSGLLSVVFSLASIFNLLLGAVSSASASSPAWRLGALVGAAGIGFLFWPEIAGAGSNAGRSRGLGLCVLGTLFFCSGNMVSTVVQRRGIPLSPPMPGA